MALTARFSEALVLAASLHRHQVRKGGNIPYISHLLAVCSIVPEHGGDEDEAIAALLHDGPEDQGGEATLEMIGRMFGERVQAIVAACSDTFETPKPPWIERKKAYIEHLSSAEVPRSAVLVSAADKLHNLVTTIDDLEAHGPALWERFNSTPEQQLWYYRSLSDVYGARLGGRLAEGVAAEVDRLEAAITGSQ
ncbi:MAG TPA: HD domain-containing protein [Acidimicrobiales bacterium]